MPNLLIDTNILLLHIIGNWKRDAVSGHRRTNTFSAADFDLLQGYLRGHNRLVTTPAVLAEASNLMGNHFHEIVATSFVATCSPLIEVTHPKDQVMAGIPFERLGFTDSSIIAALDADTMLLTDDVQLYLQAMFQGFQAVNFNHLRRFGP
jgi:hypothetical protein